MKFVMAVVLVVLFVTPVSADGIVTFGWPDVGTEIADHGDDAPDEMVKGQTYTVTAWATVDSFSKVWAKYSSDGTPSVTLGTVAKVAGSLDMSVDGVITGDSYSNQKQDSEHGTNFTVVSSVRGSDLIVVSYTFKASGKKMVGDVSVSSSAAGYELLKYGGIMVKMKREVFDELMWRWTSRVVENRTSQPVAEHVVVFGLDKATRWCKMERLDDVGWVEVPPMQPSNQIDAVHIDLMVRGLEGCWYKMTPNTGDALEFYVPNTGSTRTTEVNYGR